jgi:hypothetical protein
MSAIEAPGGGNLMDMSMDLFGGDFKPASGMFDMGEMGAAPMDMDSELDMQADQLETAPSPLQEAIRRVLKEKLLT